ncbi:hypothetical protein [uncultured Cloacibacillus sp.]|uniref:hypothetical protein n=1 Tax=uncultured Cloacibacillus sp. TaxID=889794 RepID=UPI003209E608
MKKSGISNGLNFKYWFLVGYGYKPGYRRLIDRHSFIDVFIGTVLACCVPTSLKEAATTILFPLTGILVGVCASWAGPAQEVLTSKDVIPFLEKHKGGIQEYFFILQTVIFVMLVSIILWGLAGIGIFETLGNNENNCVRHIYIGVSFLLYAVLSLSIRTCWEAVSYAHHIMYTKIQLQKIKQQKEGREYNKPIIYRKRCN